MPAISVLLVYTKVPRSTKKMVARVRQMYATVSRNAIVDALVVGV